MKILGIRNAPQKIRYALLDLTKADSFINAHSENRLVFPKGISSISKKVLWFKTELDRIFEANKDIEAIALKINENVQTRYDRVKETAYFDAIAHMVAEERGIPIECYQYSKLPGSNKTIVDKMLEKFPPSDTHWDSQMADALAAASVVK